MEGDLAYLRGGKRSERVCSREERKRRKTSMAAEGGPSGQQRHPEGAPVSSASLDDRSSAASGLDVADRLTYLEQRMQMQEDEIQMLKMALADVLKRLNISEEHQAAAAGRRAPCCVCSHSQTSVYGSALQTSPGYFKHCLLEEELDAALQLHNQELQPSP